MITKIKNILKYAALLLFFSLFSNMSISRAQNENLTSESLFRQGEYFEQMKDYKQAIGWFLKSAEKNNTKAQHKVGTFYEYGIGVKKNYITASKWYTKAAEQGNLLSLRKLERLTFIMEENFALTGALTTSPPTSQTMYQKVNRSDPSTKRAPSISKKTIYTEKTNKSEIRERSWRDGLSLEKKERINLEATLYLSDYLNGFVDTNSINKNPALEFAWSRIGAALTCDIQCNQKQILSNLEKVYDLDRGARGYSSEIQTLNKLDPITYHHLQSKKITGFCSKERKIKLRKEITKLENGFLPKKYYVNEGIEIPPNFRQ